MKAAEKKAVKKRNVQQKLEWSPYVGLWIRRKQTIMRINRWRLGYCVNEAKLRRACERQRLKDPSEYERKELEAELEATEKKLEESAKVAPKLRKKFLMQLRKSAEKLGDVKKARRLG